MTAHVVMFSSGVASWAAAKRVTARYGAASVYLLFADVKGQNDSEHAGEDADNYRFLHEAAANVGAQLVVLNEGRDLYGVYRDEHMLGNSRVAPCSKRLKQEPARAWMRENFPEPESATVYVGLDWSEGHRHAANVAGWAPYRVEFPLSEAPYLDKQDIFAWLKREGIRPPRLYEMGFQHANCGGFCCRMGHTQAAHLLRVMPERYAYHEAREQEFRNEFGRDVAFLRDRTDGETKPLTLQAFRERSEAGGQADLFDWGGCGCFTPESPESEPAA